MRLEISALSTLPEIRPGDDLVALIKKALSGEGELADQSMILAVAQKIVSKAENAIVDLREMKPSVIAQSWASRWGKRSSFDPKLIFSQSKKRIVKMDRGVLIAETRHGFVCANAGVDQSNTESERRFCDHLRPLTRMLRRIVCDPGSDAEPSSSPTRLAGLGVKVWWMSPLALLDLSLSRIAAAARIGVAASSSEPSSPWQISSPRPPEVVLMIKSGGCPVVLIRGFEWQAGEGSARSLVRDADHDLFR